MRLIPNFIRQLVGRQLEAKAARHTASFIWLQGQPIFTSFNYQKWVTEAFQDNPYFYRAIMLIADGCAGIPLKVVQRIKEEETGEDVLEEVPAVHPMARLIEAPNAWQSTPELVQENIASFLMGGSSFMLGVGPGIKPSDSAPPRKLLNMRPDLVGPIPGELAGEVRGFEIQTARGREKVAAEDMFWHRAFHPLTRYEGQPPGLAAGKSIDTNNAARRFNKSTLDNGGVPGMVLEAEGEIGDEDRENLEELLNMKFGGPLGAGKTWLLEGGVKASKIGMTMQEMSWEALMSMTAREIGLVFGVPPELLGDGSQKTFSNYREARAALYTETILPRMDLWTKGFSRWLAEWFGDQYMVIYERDQIEALQEDAEKAWNRVLKAQDQGTITINEGRQELGYGDVEAGDTNLVKSGIVPLESVAGDTADLGVGNVPPEDELDAEPEEEPTEEPAAEADPGVSASGKDTQVAATAMNGAQVTSMIGVIQQVAAGTLPMDSAKAILKLAFQLDDQEVAALLDPVAGFEVVEEEPAAGPAPTEPDPDDGDEEPEEEPEEDDDEEA